MRNHHHLSRLFGLMLIVLFGLSSCTDEQATAPMPLEAAYTDSMPASTSVNYLVSDVPDLFPGSRPDPMLRNGWGMATGNGMIWVASEGTGVALAYDQFGNPMHPPVTIPTRTGEKGGAPIAVAFNNTQGFTIPGMGIAQYLFASSDGSISAWAGGEQAQLVATSSGEAEYTGLAVLSNPRGETYLYAADFKGGKIDVYDKNFQPVSGMAFTYPGQEGQQGFAPFNIVAIGRLLFVAYAMRGPDGEEVRGPGMGFVNIYSLRGMFIRRIASGADLNAPWGITAVQSDPYSLYTTLYIANFGDGTISTYDANGYYTGQLHGSDGNLIQIDGLWGILASSGPTTPGLEPKTLWFAAGPYDETHGTFGSIKLY
jgi:uncharacterized protein (TIGR03118 family)